MISLCNAVAISACGLGLLACEAIERDGVEFQSAALDSMHTSPIVADLDEPADYPWTNPDEEAFDDILPASLEPPRIAGDELVTLELRGTPLAQALHLIGEKAGVNMILDAALDGRVDASFPSVRLDDALFAILDRHGLTLVEDPPGIFWVRVSDGTEPMVARFSLRSVGAADVFPKLQELVGGTATVVADENQNIVMVNGTRSDIELAADYLDGADRLKPQVLIEVHLFEVDLDDQFELGISQEFSGSINGNPWTIAQNLGAISDATPNFSTTLTDSGGDFEATINALRRVVGLELISSPRVLAVTNTEATVEVVEEVPYIETTSSITTDGGSSESSFEQVAFKEAGVTLRVTPTIQDAGILQIQIDQQLSEVVDYFQGVPVIDRRQITSQFLVADRQTIVLGGLMADARRDVDDGVPVLMNIPILGRLFRRDIDSVEKRELLVFITPRILDPNEAAQVAKKYEREYRERRRAGFTPLGQHVEPGLGPRGGK